MKLRLISCLLAASAMLSVQAVKVVNETTTKTIILSGFGFLSQNRGMMYSRCEDIELEPGYEYDTENEPVHVMTVKVGRINQKFEDLTKDSVITYVEDEDGTVTVNRK